MHLVGEDALKVRVEDVKRAIGARHLIIARLAQRLKAADENGDEIDDGAAQPIRDLATVSSATLLVAEVPSPGLKTQDQDDGPELTVPKEGNASGLPVGRVKYHTLLCSVLHRGPSRGDVARDSDASPRLYGAETLDRPSSPVEARSVAYSLAGAGRLRSPTLPSSRPPTMW